MKALSPTTIQLVENLSKAMDELTKHWYELSDDEAELLSKGYPLFWGSFDEKAEQVNTWLINLKDNMAKKVITYEVRYQKLVDGEYEPYIQSFKTKEEAEEFAEMHYSNVEEVDKENYQF